MIVSKNSYTIRKLKFMPVKWVERASQLEFISSAWWQNTYKMSIIAFQANRSKTWKFIVKIDTGGQILKAHGSKSVPKFWKLKKIAGLGDILVIVNFEISTFLMFDLLTKSSFFYIFFNKIQH